MATDLDVREVSQSPDRLLEHVRHGEELTLVDGGQPVAKVVPIKRSPATRGGFGMFKGQIWVADDFTGPLPEDELREWEK
jgi:antitoxin (DNA-binding transcriptional repressor) of toxin-antitoxin stability system